MFFIIINWNKIKKKLYIEIIRQINVQGLVVYYCLASVAKCIEYFATTSIQTVSILCMKTTIVSIIVDRPNVL